MPIARRQRAPRLTDLFDAPPTPQATSSDSAEPSRAALRDLDRRLATRARSEGRLCLQLGELLERFARLGGPGAFSYSTRGNYAIQVIGRGARWAGDLCALARAVEPLPLIRAALATGRIGRSMARLLAKHATPETEAALLLDSRGRTVRAMAARLEANLADESPGEHNESSTIEVTVPTSDVWAYEYVRLLLDRGLGCRTRDEVIEGMLAEGALVLSLLDPDMGVPVAPPAHPAAQWRHGRAEKDAEIEAELEHRVDLEVDAVDLDPLPSLESLSDDIYVLHGQIERLAADFARRDQEMGELALRFWKADGWRTLGYTSATQYARERLGCSLSSVQQRMRLARNIATMPAVERALQDGNLGFEAAMLVVRTCGPTRRPELAEAWVARARERTVLDLREEVQVAETCTRLSGCTSDLEPPCDETMADYVSTRQAVLSGEVFGRDGSAGSESEQGVEDEVQMFVSAGDEPPRRGGGMRTLRFRMRDDLARWWRQLDKCWRRACCRLDLGDTFLSFLCLATVDAWRENVNEAARVKYAHIYARDGYRCSSPICNRSDVTPHHLVLRSRGGGEEDSNLASLCVRCHLDFVHGVDIQAEGPADRIRWLLGRVPQLEVVGRVMKRVA